MSKEQEIVKFLSTEQSLVRKAKRYEEDVRYLLNQLNNERVEVSNYLTTSNVSKIKQIELLANILKEIDQHYQKPFKTTDQFNKLEAFTFHLFENNDGKEQLIMYKILKLIIDYYNRLNE